VVTEFLRGLTSTTRNSWLGIVAFALLEFCIACAFFTPRRLARQDPQLLMQSTTDDYAALTIRVLEYHYSHPQGPQVVYLGGSSAKFALPELDERTLSDALSREVGTPSRFLPFVASSERVEHALQLCDQLPDGFDGAVVLVTNPHKSGDEGRRLHDIPLESPALTKLEGDDRLSMDRRTGIFFLDHLRFFAARRDLLIRAPHGRLEPPTEAPLMSAEELFAMEQKFIRRAASRPTIQLLNDDRRHLERLIENMKCRHVLTVLVEAPIHPVAGAIMDRYEPHYREKLASFARERGAVYLDFNDEVRFVASDFSDLQHVLSPDARRRYTSSLMKHLGALLRDAR
jgi:hypothetical protein